MPQTRRALKRILWMAYPTMWESEVDQHVTELYEVIALEAVQIAELQAIPTMKGTT